MEAESSTTKKPRLNSVGSRLNTLTSNAASARGFVVAADSEKKLVDDSVLETAIDSLSECCIDGGKTGCIMKHFPGNDYGGAINYVRKCRIRGLQPDNFVFNLVKDTVDSVKRGVKQDRLQQTFSMPPIASNAIGRKEKIECCVKGFRVVYGITEQEYRNAASALRQSGKKDDSALVTSSGNKHRMWSDDFIHPFSFADGESIYKKHVPRCSIAGEYECT
jgi:hypothetical protein